MRKKISIILICLSAFIITYCNAEVEIRKKESYGGGYSEIQYRDGKKNGIAKFYDKDGRLRAESFFKDDKKEGMEKQYDGNGKLMVERIWKDGKPEVLKKYDEQGNLVYEGTYENDKFVIKKSVKRTKWSSGQLFSETFFKDGKKEGIEKTYSPKGNLMTETSFINGKKEGKMEYFDAKGNVIMEVVYKDDKIVDTILSEAYTNKAKEVSEKLIKSLIDKKYKETTQYPPELLEDKNFQTTLSIKNSILDAYLKVLGEVESYKFKALKKIDPLYISPGGYLYSELSYEIKFKNDLADSLFIITYADHYMGMNSFQITPHSDKYRQLIDKEWKSLVVKEQFKQ